MIIEDKVMQKTTFVRARVEPALKVNVDAILDELGITTTQAITMLYKRIAREHAWPLELKVPNAKTRKVLAETDKGVGLVECKNKEDLFKKLDIEEE